MSPPKQESEPKVCLVWAWPWATMTTTDFPICSFSATAAAFSITTMATAPSPTSPPAPACKIQGLWASSAAWFDYDNDGRLDLVIANYVDWSPERNFYCGDPGPGMRSYCHPDDFHGQPPTLYHNNGDGTFTDVSKSSGVGLKGGNGLGVVTFDYDNDGWQDIFIANDHMPNFLFHNNRDGTFREVGYLAGVAVSADGQFEAGMGTDAADTTGNGRLDLIVTHLDMQLARLYQNMGDQTFDDATFRSKLSYATYHMSSFGTRFMDYDNDGGARPLHGERPRARQHPALPRRYPVCRAQVDVSQHGTRNLRKCQRPAWSGLSTASRKPWRSHRRFRQ